MPQGTFQGAGVKTVVLFFEKGAPTRDIWFYKLDPGRSLGKTTALNDSDLEDFVRLQASFEDSENSWSVDAKVIAHLPVGMTMAVFACGRWERLDFDAGIAF